MTVLLAWALVFLALVVLILGLALIWLTMAHRLLAMRVGRLERNKATVKASVR